MCIIGKSANQLSDRDQYIIEGMVHHSRFLSTDIVSINECYVHDNTV